MRMRMDLSVGKPAYFTAFVFGSRKKRPHYLKALFDISGRPDSNRRMSAWKDKLVREGQLCPKLLRMPLKRFG
jgi:hypothetical protein